ncbi:MAG TPA: helix-turn-helix transcriptional regulator [Xanthobacteraceae bacterium]|nr:helix-turn-helix transcriptional regulator [Xanthobacteraceae bacterium]
MSTKTPNSIDVAVGRNVRIRRMAKGLSQSQLGRRLGITFQQVQKYEKGTNRIGSGRLVRIAEILEVPVAALFDGVDGPSSSGVPSGLHLLADRRSLRLAQAFAVIQDAAVRLSIVGLVERVAAAVPRPRLRRR